MDDIQVSMDEIHVLSDKMIVLADDITTDGCALERCAYAHPYLLVEKLKVGFHPEEVMYHLLELGFHPFPYRISSNCCHRYRSLRFVVEGFRV